MPVAASHYPERDILQQTILSPALSAPSPALRALRESWGEGTEVDRTGHMCNIGANNAVTGGWKTTLTGIRVARRLWP